MPLKRRNSDPPAEAALLWPLRKPTRGKALIFGQRSPQARAKIFTPDFRATDRGALVQCVADGDGAGRRAEPIAGMAMCLKRMMDVFVSSVALLFLWPLMLVIAIAVKLESRGPVIYRSLRVGKKGHKFACYKFRTMVDGANELKESLRRFNERRDPFFKIADDPRVTLLGRLLRKYSLDELPQFWNVLKGDMSLVGPRPHPVDDCARYRPGDHRRLDVKPGITGLWQVIARTDPSFETCMKLDLEYMKRWSLSLDLKLLVRTVPAVLAGEGS